MTNFRRIIQTQVSPSPSKATVDPPSGTPSNSPLEEKLNTPPASGYCELNLHIPTVNLLDLQSQVGEMVVGRTGGAVSLAVGMAQIFASIPGMRGLMAYWYHFAIMF